MQDYHDSSALERNAYPEEIANYLATKEALERAKAAYDSAKDAYDKAKQHDGERKAGRAAHN